VEVEFVVEHAGCASCSERVRGALTTFGAVREIEIDEADDSASVRGDFSPGTSPDAVDSTLVEVSVGSGHEYRVRPGSWRATG
jgi:hypothetical protein